MNLKLLKIIISQQILPKKRDMWKRIPVFREDESRGSLLRAAEIGPEPSTKACLLLSPKAASGKLAESLPLVLMALSRCFPRYRCTRYYTLTHKAGASRGLRTSSSSQPPVRDTPSSFVLSKTIESDLVMLQKKNVHRPPTGKTHHWDLNTFTPMNTKMIDALDLLQFPAFFRWGSSVQCVRFLPKLAWLMKNAEWNVPGSPRPLVTFPAAFWAYKTLLSRTKCLMWKEKQKKRYRTIPKLILTTQKNIRGGGTLSLQFLSATSTSFWILLLTM